MQTARRRLRVRPEQSEGDAGDEQREERNVSFFFHSLSFRSFRLVSLSLLPLRYPRGRASASGSCLGRRRRRAFARALLPSPAFEPHRTMRAASTRLVGRLFQLKRMPSVSSHVAIQSS